MSERDRQTAEECTVFTDFVGNRVIDYEATKQKIAQALATAREEGRQESLTCLQSVINEEVVSAEEECETSTFIAWLKDIVVRTGFRLEKLKEAQERERGQG